MKSNEIRTRFLEFFRKRGHAIIPSASLVPENDPSSLFNTAGMQPLVPYLLGAKHPSGARLADAQKCVRTGDIEDIGDNRHLTFFEMLGNWSLGDYFKKESIEWSFDFLTSKEEGLGLDPKRFFVTTFKGEDGIPRDEESIAIWKEVFAKHGIDAGVAKDDEEVRDNVRIIPLGVKDNFWIAGATGPCGGDTEIFYDTKADSSLVGKFGDLVDSFRIIEVWNNVFMEFNKTAGGKYEKLAKQNVDTGMGLERTTVVVNGKDNVFDTDIFEEILVEVRKITNNQKSERIVADHFRASCFIISDGVTPANTDRGYILRRLIRRAVFATKNKSLTKEDVHTLVSVIVDKFGGVYENLKIEKEKIIGEIVAEVEKFGKTIANGVREFEKISKKDISGKDAFMLFSSYGFPVEMTVELAKEKGVVVDRDGFADEFKKHQDLSRAGSEQKFKGGLAGTGEIETRYHTATHLLNAGLRAILGGHVMQKGSNITSDRLRFDFTHGAKMTDEEKKKVEDFVNEKIKSALPVVCVEMPKTEAEKIAVHAFNEKYGDQVKVYSIGDDKTGYVSREFCGGPHVQNTSELGTFKIQKEEAVSAGVRRIKAVLS